jgi:hypothetical protein
VNLRVLPKEFEDDGLVSHVGLLLRGCRVQTRNWLGGTSHNPEPDGQPSVVPCRFGVSACFQNLPFSSGHSPILHYLPP